MLQLPFLLTKNSTQPDYHNNKSRAKSLRQAYDDICNSNISSRSFFGKENEDPSESSCTFESSFQLHSNGSLPDFDLELETTMEVLADNDCEEEEEAAVAGVSHKVENLKEAEEEKQKSVKACKVDPAQVEALQAQLANLERQLADKDSQLESVQRQMEQERRSHDKLRFHWNLFCGRRKNDQCFHSMMSCSCMMPSMGGKKHDFCHGHTKDSTKSNFVKMVQLSVALAESKAQVSNLKAQLEESQNLVLYQCGAKIDS